MFAKLKQFIQLLLRLDAIKDLHKVLEIEFCIAAYMFQELIDLCEPVLGKLHIVDNGSLLLHLDPMVLLGLLHTFLHVLNHLLIERICVVLNDLLKLFLQINGYLSFGVKHHTLFLGEIYFV